MVCGSDADSAAWLDETLSALPEEKFNVLGLSIGGWTATNLAVHRPERINALMLMLTGWLAEQLGLGFHVDGFWTAVGGAVVITVVTWALDAVFDSRARA